MTQGPLIYEGLTLPYDYARCLGAYEANRTELREPCKECRRREYGRAEYQSYMGAAVENGVCRNQIIKGPK